MKKIIKLYWNSKRGPKYMENYTMFIKMWIQFPKDVNIPKISYKHKIIPIQSNVTNLSHRTELSCCYLRWIWNSLGSLVSLTVPLIEKKIHVNSVIKRIKCSDIYCKQKAIWFTKNWNIYVNIKKLRMWSLGKAIVILVARWHFSFMTQKGSLEYMPHA